VVPTVHSDCSISRPEERVLTVQSCRLVDPYQVKKIMEFADRYPESFVGSAREQFVKEAQGIVESYRGAVIEEATKEGGQNQYFYSSKDMNICAKFPQEIQIKALVASACCDGDPNPPCYLGLRAYIVSGSDEPVKKSIH